MDGNCRSLRKFLPLFSFFLLAVQPAFSQEVTAAINGVVTDPSGAAMVGAKITAKDLDRGATYETLTDSVGRYNIPRVAVGTYEVRAESAASKRQCNRRSCWS